MYQFEHTTKEYMEAVERINQRQNTANLFTNISDKEVFEEIKRHKEQAAADLARAIKTFAERPEALDNFQSYLSYHFTTWMEKWANDPAGLASEFLYFANME